MAAVYESVNNEKIGIVSVKDLAKKFENDKVIFRLTLAGINQKKGKRCL